MTNNNNKHIKESETQIPYRLPYRTRIGFSQSLSTGIIAIEGSIQYDYEDEADNCIDQLTTDIWKLEKKFIEMGYKVAKTIEPKVKEDNKKETTTKELKINSNKNKSKKVTK
jgi:hypothetical protein